MPNRQLRHPEDARTRLSRSWARNRSDWLGGGGQWPLELTLGHPTEADARGNLDAVAGWVRDWQDHVCAGQVVWEERHWRDVGRQRIPVRLALASADEVALWVGEDRRWQTARQRYHRLVHRWEALRTALPKHFDVLADYRDEDFERLLNMVSWLVEHPASNMFPRQIPVPGLDSKWLEVRRGLIADLVGTIRPVNPTSRDFFECCGLRALPLLVRINILDNKLRSRVGGVRDVTVPADELCRLDIPARYLFVVENLQTGLAFHDLDDTVVVMALGYGVDALQGLPCAQRAATFYWGDIDTHGFAILSRARVFVPQLQSLMMDECTILQHRDLCVEEQAQHPSETLPNLTPAEHDVFRGLKSHKWGQCLRLEQERISWPEAWCKIQDAREGHR